MKNPKKSSARSWVRSIEAALRSRFLFLSRCVGLRPLIALIAVLGVTLAARSADAQTVVRGPYLQQGSNTQVTVRWRTDVATDSRVRYGTTLTDPLPQIVTDATSTTEHVVTVTGLAANTKYYYSIGTSSATLSGPDANTFVLTAPTPGVAKDTRIWVLGDAGTKNTNQKAVRDAYYAFTGARHTDLWLMLGDNAYSSGTDSDFQTAVFDGTYAYPAMLRKSVLWPTIGNHECVSANSINQTGPHYDIFTLPKNGEAGGLPSGTEAYYSFDYGNIHFINLESNQIPSNASALATMKTWLTNDIAATSREWIIAYWHQPPYSKGSHDSDTDGTMTKMRTDINPILEDGGVDLVLSGHSHSYERSFLIDGHYGTSGTFTSSMKIDGGSGRDPSPYDKPGLNAPHAGAVYLVCGSSGQTASGALNHPVMFYSAASLGSVVLDVNGSRLDAKFLRETGATDDWFSIQKGAPPPPLPTVTVMATDATATEAGSNNGTFKFTRTGDTSSLLTVNFAMSGSATNGTDYSSITSPVTIPAGSSSTTITLVPINDGLQEGDETAILTISSNPSYQIGSPASAAITIVDDDIATVTIAASDPTAVESTGSTGTFTVSRTGSTASPLSVSFSIGGTATNGTDYTTIASPVTIPAGASSATITVTPVDDGTTEADETVILTVTSGSGYAVGAASNATVTISDSNPAASGGGGSGGGGACGATGLESLFVFAGIWAVRRRRRILR